MRRTFEECRYRRPLGSAAGDGLAICRLLAELSGVDAAQYTTVGRDACTACCRCLAPPEALNPVMASLLYRLAGDLARSGGTTTCSRDAATKLRERVVSHMGLVHSALPTQCFPPEQPRRQSSRVCSAPKPNARLTWQLGVLTAPRAIRTLDGTLRSLARAGYGPLRIFAEPGAWLPAEASGQRVILREQRLGNFANFYSALAELYESAPDADCFAIFQDDVVVADGLKEWCDGQFWPFDSGLVSLFTPRIHSRGQVGWFLRQTGYHRVFGGQSLVFRNETLQRFLADPQVLRAYHTGRHGDDAVVSSWAARQRCPIAYHSPSLVQHVGVVSSIYPSGPDPRVVADAVSSVRLIPEWRAPPRSRGRVGLVGWHAANGLGYQTYDLAKHLAVERWLVPFHPQLPTHADPQLTCQTEYVPLDVSRNRMRKWVRGLDWLVFIERPYLRDLVVIAREQHVAVACIPNWEWMTPDDDWLCYVDVMICPTRHTYLHVCDWRRRFGFGWNVVHVPWPVDTRKFQFRHRRQCKRFVFINGWGGGRARYPAGPETPYARKGLELVLQSARLAPRLSFLIYSQNTDLPQLPRNVELRKAPADNRLVYSEGDVCVQPSHWEGLGLQLLECQAAGMPLVTTDAPPMNEFEPLAVVPVSRKETVLLPHGYPITSQVMSPESLVAVLDELDGADISDASRRAREFAEREHSWSHTCDELHHLLARY